MSATITAESATTPAQESRLSLPTLTALVVGSMVGAGVFSLPARFGVATGILGSLIAWAIWIGVYPQPHFAVLEKPVAQIVERVRPDYFQKPVQQAEAPKAAEVAR